MGVNTAFSGDPLVADPCASCTSSRRLSSSEAQQASTAADALLSDIWLEAIHKVHDRTSLPGSQDMQQQNPHPNIPHGYANAALGGCTPPSPEPRADDGLLSAISSSCQQQKRQVTNRMSRNSCDSGGRRGYQESSSGLKVAGLGSRGSSNSGSKLLAKIRDQLQLQHHQNITARRNALQTTHQHIRSTIGVHDGGTVLNGLRQLIVIGGGEGREGGEGKGGASLRGLHPNRCQPDPTPSTLFHHFPVTIPDEGTASPRRSGLLTVLRETSHRGRRWSAAALAAPHDFVPCSSAAVGSGLRARGRACGLATTTPTSSANSAAAQGGRDHKCHNTAAKAYIESGATSSSGCVSGSPRQIPPGGFPGRAESEPMPLKVWEIC